jgi:hypothetical protein
MAIGRISGALLFSDLDRQGVDLSVTTNGRPLQHLDFTNFRFGVNTNSLVDTFTVQGTANVSGVTKIYGNLVAAAGTPSTDTTTGALVVLGGFGVTGNLYAGNLHAANFTGNIVGPTGGSATFDNLVITNFSTLANTTIANAIINNGYITNLANAYITLGYFDNLSTPNVVISGGYISNLTNANITTGNTVSWNTGNLNANTGNITTLQASTTTTANLNSTTGNITTLGVDTTTTANLNSTTGNITTLGVGTTTTVILNVTTGNITTLGVDTTTTANLNSTTGNITNLAVSTTTTTNLNSTTGNITNLTATTVNAATTTSTIINSTTGNITNLNSNVIAANNFSTANAIISSGYISSLTNAYITTSAVTNFSSGNIYITGGYIENLTNATITSGNSVSWTTTTLNATEANITRAAIGNLSTANAVITGGYISGISNITATTANLGNIKVENITISSLIGNIKINPLASNGNALVIMEATSALQVPSGTSAQQPVTAYPGAIRWNTNTETIEFYTGSDWISIVNQIYNQDIVPNGTNTVYTLNYNTTAEGIIVSINGTLQQPGTAYSVAGNQITFAEVPLVTDIISIRFISSGVVEDAIDFGNIASNVTPVANVTYDLGSSTQRWRDLWLAGNSIHLGNATITSTGNAVQLPAGSTVGGANVDITSINSNIESISANLGAYQTFANSNSAVQQTQIDNLVTQSNANTAAYLLTDTANIASTISTSSQPYITTLDSLNSFGNTAGNVSSLGNLTIFGNLNVRGNTITIGSNNLTVVDSIIDLHSPSDLSPLTTDDGRDIGVRFHYYKGADDHAFLGWENEHQTLIYLQRSDEVNSNIAGTFGNVQFGSLLLSNTTPSTSTITGALQVRGGVGISGALWVGANVNVGGGNNTNNVVDNVTQPRTLVVSAADSETTPGAGTNAIAIVNSNTTPNNLSQLNFAALTGGSNQNAFSSAWIAVRHGPRNTDTYQTGRMSLAVSTASAQAPAERLVIDTTGNVVVTSTTGSASTTTGALVVRGGVGVAGTINATSGEFTTLSVTSTVSGTGFNNLFATPPAIGSSFAASGAFTTLSASSTLESTGITRLGSVGSNVVIRSTTASTSLTTGALVVRGGLGVNGDVVSTARRLINASFQVQRTITYTATQTNANTTTDFDITSLLSGSPFSPTLVTTTLIGVYIGDGAVPNTNSRLYKRWQSMAVYNSSTGFYTLEGEQLIGTVHNTDGTNFAAGAVNARNFLTGSGTGTINLRVTNRTTPAATSFTYWVAIIEIQYW